MEAKQRAEHLVLKFGTIGTCWLAGGCGNVLPECAACCVLGTGSSHRLLVLISLIRFKEYLGLGTGFDLHSP